MKPTLAGAAYVHPRPLAHGFQAFQHLWRNYKVHQMYKSKTGMHAAMPCLGTKSFRAGKTRTQFVNFRLCTLGIRYLALPVPLPVTASRKILTWMDDAS